MARRFSLKYSQVAAVQEWLELQSPKDLAGPYVPDGSLLALMVDPVRQELSSAAGWSNVVWPLQHGGLRVAGLALGWLRAPSGSVSSAQPQQSHNVPSAVAH